MKENWNKVQVKKNSKTLVRRQNESKMHQLFNIFFFFFFFFGGGGGGYFIDVRNMHNCYMTLDYVRIPLTREKYT